MNPTELVTPDLRVRAKNIDAALIGSRLKYARQRAGLTQGEAAGDHMSTAYISRIEAGQRRASPELLVQLAGRLGCDVDELIAPEDDGAAAELVARMTPRARLRRADLRTGDSAAALTRVTGLLAEDVVPDEILVKGRYLRALAFEAEGRLDDAIVVLEDVVSDASDGLVLIRSLIALSRCYREEGDLARACEIGERAELLVGSTDLHGSAEGIQLAVTVAAAHYERGDVNYALRMCERAIASAELLESPKARASAYWNSSIVHQRQGNIAAALPLAQKAIALLEQTHDARHKAVLRMQLGLLQLESDPPELDGAILNLTQAYDEMTWSDASIFDRGRAELGLARARLLIGDVEEAERLAEDCYRVTETANALLATEACAVLGRVEAARNKVDEAVQWFRQGILLLSSAGADREAAQLWFELGTLLQEFGAIDDALDAFRRAGASTGLTPPTVSSTKVSTRSG